MTLCPKPRKNHTCKLQKASLNSVCRSNKESPAHVKDDRPSSKRSRSPDIFWHHHPSPGWLLGWVCPRGSAGHDAVVLSVAPGGSARQGTCTAWGGRMLEGCWGYSLPFREGVRVCMGACTLVLVCVTSTTWD